MSAASAVNESVVTWPVADFEKQHARLVAELERAIRDLKSKTSEIADLQQRAELSRLSVAIMIGKDQAEKMDAEQGALIRAVEAKRAEFRKFVDDEHAAFVAYKAAAYRRLRPEIEAKRGRAKALAEELSPIFSGLLGAKSVIDLQEKAIRERNRIAARINRTIPQMNVHNIPAIAVIHPGNSLLGVIAGMLRDDPILRGLARELLELDAKDRQSRAEREEFVAKLNEPPIF